MRYKVTLWREGECFGSLDLEDTPEAAEAAGVSWLEKMSWCSGKKEFSFKVEPYVEEAPKPTHPYKVAVCNYGTKGFLDGTFSTWDDAASAGKSWVEAKKKAEADGYQPEGGGPRRPDGFTFEVYSMKGPHLQQEAPKPTQVFVVTQQSSDTLVVLSSEQMALDYMNAHVQHICQRYIEHCPAGVLTPEETILYTRITKLPLNEMLVAWNAHFAKANPTRLFRHGPFVVDMHMFNPLLHPPKQDGST